MSKHLFGIDITRHYELSKSDIHAEYQMDDAFDKTDDKSFVQSSSKFKSVVSKQRGKIPLSHSLDDVKVLPSVPEDESEHTEYNF